MNRNKICIICPQMGVSGGLQRVVTNMINHLSQYYDLTVGVVSVNGNNSFYLMREEVDIFEIKEATYDKKKFWSRCVRKVLHYVKCNIPARLYQKIYYPQYRILALQDFLKRNDYYCIIAACGDLSMLLATIDKMKLRAKLIGWQHNSFSAYFRTRGKYYYGREKLAANFYKKLDGLITLTEKDAREYQKEIGIECKCIYNPLSFCSQKKTEIEQKSMIFVGRLDFQQKGLDYLAKILERIFKDPYADDWNVLIVGDGNGRLKFENLLNEYGIASRVVMIGETNHVINYYLQASLFLGTSRWEGFGLVITEAMECGLPVVSFETDGPSEIIKDSENGYLVPKYNLDLYAQKVLTLIKNPDLRKSMSYNATVRAKDFSIEFIEKQWMKIINGE